MRTHYVKILFHAGFVFGFLLNLSTTQLVPAETNETNPLEPSHLIVPSEADAIDTNGKAKEDRGAFDGLVPKMLSLVPSIRSEMAWLQNDPEKALELLPPLKEGESLDDNEVYRQWLHRAVDLFSKRTITMDPIIQSLKTKTARGATEQVYHWLKENKRTAEEELDTQMRSVCKENLMYWDGSAKTIWVAENLLSMLGITNNQVHAQLRRVRGLQELWDALLVDMASNAATSKLAYVEWQAVSKHPTGIFISLNLANKIEDPLMLTQWLEYAKWYFSTQTEAPLQDEYILQLFGKEMSPVAMAETSALLRQSPEWKDISERMLTWVLYYPVSKKKLFDEWRWSKMRPEMVLQYLHLDDRHEGDSKRFLLLLTYVRDYLHDRDEVGTTSSFSYGDLVKVLEALTTRKTLLKELYTFHADPNVMKQFDVKDMVNDMLIYTLFESKGSRWYVDLADLKGSGALFADQKFIALFKSRNAPEEIRPLSSWLASQMERAIARLKQYAKSSKFQHDIDNWLSSGRNFDNLERLLAIHPDNRYLLDNLRQVNDMRKLKKEYNSLIS